MDKILALWRKHLEDEIEDERGDARLANIRYSEGVSFSCDARVPRASLYRRRPRRAKKVVDSPSSPIARRTLHLKDAAYEWVDYSAPLVCLEEEEDGVCLREEPSPCSDDPNSLVCSIDTRQLPQKRKRHPWVSVCIDDMGVDYYMSRRAVRLRPAVTLSYLPYGPQVREQARAAAAAGHELMVHLPMEPFNKAADAGPNALHSSMTQKQLSQHLHWALSQFDGYVGLNNHMGSLFTSRFHDGMRLVLEELRRRDLFFLDSLTANDSLGQELAAHMGTTFGARDVFLDSQRDDVGAVEERLEEVEQLALKNGHAIAIGHPYAATLEALERWLPLLQAKGLRLMPLKKALLRERKERERMAGEAVLAFTRSKQLRAVQALRDREVREVHARAMAAQLEAEFGDGTVLGWQGLLDVSAVDALRLVLEKRRQAPNGLKASLQRLLLLTPFHGGRGARSPHVEKAAVRLLRMRGSGGRVADLVAPQSTQAVGRVRRREGRGARKLPARSRMREVRLWSQGERRGLGGLLGEGEGEGEGQGFPEEAQSEEGPRAFCGGINTEPGVLAMDRPLPSREYNRKGRRTRARAGQNVQPRPRPDLVAATEWAAQVACAGQQRFDGTAGAEGLSLGVHDLLPGVLVSVPQSEKGAQHVWSEGRSSKQRGGNVFPQSEERTRVSWQHGAGSTLAMRRWLAGSRGGEVCVENDSPRTVLATEEFEAATDTSSQEESPLGSGVLSVSSDSSDVAAVGEASEGAWSPERSSSRSSSSSSRRRSLDSVSEASSQSEERQEEEQGGDTACRLIVTAATGLAVALQLSLLASKGIPEGPPEAKTTITAATLAATGAVDDGHPPSATDTLAAEELKEATSSPDGVLIAPPEVVEAHAVPAATPAVPTASQGRSGEETMVHVPEHGVGSQQKLASSSDALDRSVAVVSAKAAAADSDGHGTEEEAAPPSWSTSEEEEEEAEEAVAQMVSTAGSPVHASSSALVDVLDEGQSEASVGTALVRPSVNLWPFTNKSRDAAVGLLALVQPDPMEPTRRPLVSGQRAVSPTRAQPGQELEVAAKMEGAARVHEAAHRQGGAEAEGDARAGEGLSLPKAEAEGDVPDGIDYCEEADASMDAALRATSLPLAIPSSPTPRLNPEDAIQWWDAAASPLSSARSSPASWGESRIAWHVPAPQTPAAAWEDQVAQAGVDGTWGREGRSKAGPLVAAEGASVAVVPKGDSSKKKYGWWRWTVGCVLGDTDIDMGETVEERKRGSEGKKGRGSRRVVPLNINDEEAG